MNRKAGGNVLDGVSASGNDLAAALALPDADGRALDGVLAAEGTRVRRVLRDFNLLDLLSQTGAVSGAVFARDPNLLRAFRLCQSVVNEMHAKGAETEGHDSPSVLLKA